MLQTEGSDLGGDTQEENYKSIHHNYHISFFKREPIHLSDVFDEYLYIIKMSFKNKNGQVVEHMKNTA